MWFSVTSAPTSFLKWIVTIHQIGFIVTGAMFILHIYLAVFHPLSTEAWKSMAGGRISADYARKNHGKWYEEVTRGK
jgi:formate dehydrogenase subunit gamma